jgi:hypothetical protein
LGERLQGIECEQNWQCTVHSVTEAKIQAQQHRLATRSCWRGACRKAACRNIACRKAACKKAACNKAACRKAACRKAACRKAACRKAACRKAGWLSQQSLLAATITTSMEVM